MSIANRSIPFVKDTGTTGAANDYLAPGTDGYVLTTHGVGADPTWTAGGAQAGAPADAEYLVAALHSGLSAERAITDSATITWDVTQASKAIASLARVTLENVTSDPASPAVGTMWLRTDL